jgi:hypothetical protein
MRMNIIAVLVVTHTVSGCASIPITSLPALSRINPETTNLSALRVALVLEDGLRPRKTGVVMDAVVKKDGQEKTTPFRLIEADAQVGSERSAVVVPAGSRSFFYRLDPAEVESFEALRADVFRTRNEGKRIRMGMGIAMREFCTDGTLPAGPLLSSSYLLTSETRRFVPVTRNFDLRSDKKLTDALATLEPC